MARLGKLAPLIIGAALAAPLVNMRLANPAPQVTTAREQRRADPVKAIEDAIGRMARPRLSERDRLALARAEEKRARKRARNIQILVAGGFRQAA